MRNFKSQNSVDVLHRQTHEKNQTSALETQYIQYASLHEALQAHLRGQQLDTNCRLRCQESVDPTTSQLGNLGCEDQTEPCTSETKTYCRKTKADTIKQLLSQVDHQSEASLNHDASTESIDKLQHADKAEYYIDSDDEAAVYNCDNNQQHTLNDSYYDSDSPEEEPRKRKIQHTAFMATPKRQSKLDSLAKAIAMSMQIFRCRI
jgi:hypothetical protein